MFLKICSYSVSFLHNFSLKSNIHPYLFAPVGSWKSSIDILMSRVLPFHLILTIPSTALITLSTHSFFGYFSTFHISSIVLSLFANFLIFLNFPICLLFFLMPPLPQGSVLGLAFFLLGTKMHRDRLHSHGCKHMGLMTHRFTAHVLPLAQGLFPHLWLPTGHFHLKVFLSPHVQHSLTELIISSTKPIPLSSSWFLPCRSFLMVILAQNFEVIPNLSLTFILACPQPFPIMPDNIQVLLISLPNFPYLLKSVLFPNLALHLRAKCHSPFSANLPDCSLLPSNLISYAQLVNFP